MQFWDGVGNGSIWFTSKSRSLIYNDKLYIISGQKLDGRGSRNVSRQQSAFLHYNLPERDLRSEKSCDHKLIFRPLCQQGPQTCHLDMLT